MRKAIQITKSITATQEFEEVFYCEILTALCDDGSIWELRQGNGEKREWQALPAIPQQEI